MAIPAALSGRHDPSISAHAHAMADAAAGAAGPMVLAGALLGVMVGVLRHWVKTVRGSGSDGEGDRRGDG